MTAVSDQRAAGPPAEPPAEPCMEDNPPTANLAQLVEAHQGTLWRYVRYLGASPEEADDLVQETFLSVGRSANWLRGVTGNGAAGKGFEERSPQQTAAYLRTAARNQLLMLRRRQQRRIDTVDLEAAEAVWAGAAVESSDENAWRGLLDKLGDCVTRLTGRARQVVQLQYRDGASRTAIAQQLGMQPDGVKTLLRRTRAKLRECLQRGQQEV